MSKSMFNILVILIVASPIATAGILQFLADQSRGWSFGGFSTLLQMVIGLSLLFVTVVGVIISFATRNSKDAQTWALAGYSTPAIIASAFMVYNF